jgi:predicted lipid-binding transport protein (Tim44 family)
MKKVMLMVLAVLVMTFSTVEVHAKRVGGGKSIGKQSNTAMQQAPAQSNQGMNKAAAPAQAAAPTTASPAAAKPSPWKNILGGALLGLGLGALLSHFGLGGAFASAIAAALMIALVVGVIVVLYRLLSSKKPAPQMAYSQSYGGGSVTPEIGSQVGGGQSMAAPVVQSIPGVPVDFDVPEFLRTAKVYFIRLQAAWDKGDLTDIREFTTVEMFAEIRMQIDERGAEKNVTDVISVDAELLGIEHGVNDYVASIKMSGMIKESENGAVEPFAEIWNLSKPANGTTGWVLAGITQLS